MKYRSKITCTSCCSMIMSAGVGRVIYDEVYRDSSSIQTLQEYGIEVFQYDSLMENLNELKAKED